MTIDYDKLLEEAKKRYEKVLELDREAANLFIYDRKPEEYWPVQEKLIAEKGKYRDWEKNNIEKLGVRLLTDFNNGTPIGISAVISGHDNFGGQT